ncbi:MAG: UDP-N-acetylmuramate:L-alanyl-gamma-D-glutamyl-meso-diaminopimelate ligase [Gammaproteobacteria bacterium]|nr:UDP-N-acetylmuramate:L-alanyl-gamma-D-glutamyl-meso-diaminopimelate ligase [Gammaproteobacteria bacterium]
MHFHILGICGTFMGGLAALLRELGHMVTGSDQHIYPPMSMQLAALKISLWEGYSDPDQLNPKPDYVVVGNVMSRGMPVIEALLDRKISLVSGPECLARFVLSERTVFAVSGTHGKTSTSSMLAWILESAGQAPGFLIGGIPKNFDVSARLGKGMPFVIEADEYDSAFFDKRSKFVHYHPQVLIINNIEFDHADIFPDLAAIEQQFHHCVRTVPASGLIVHPSADPNVLRVLKKGCWTPCINFGATKQAQWHAVARNPEGASFDVYQGEQCHGTVSWSLVGKHNIHNALAAIVAASYSLDPKLAVEALCGFSGVKRRLDYVGEQAGVKVYDDFAHHPTAIHTTLAGLRAKIGKARLIAVLDIRSNTMQAGHHREQLAGSVVAADQIYCFYPPNLAWDIQAIFETMQKPGGIYTEVDPLCHTLLRHIQAGDHVVFMSNGAFGGIHQKLLEGLRMNQ